MTPDLSGHGRGRATLSSRQALVDVVLALALAVGGALLAPLAGQLLLGPMGVPLLMVLVVQGGLVLLGLQLLLNWRGQHWRDIGFRPLRGRDVGFALVALLLVFVVNVLVSFTASRLAPDLVQVHQQRLGTFATLLTGDLSIAVVGGAMLFTGFYEEVLARGFLLTRCRTLLGGYWGPVLLSSLLFGLGHFYQGWLGVVQTALVGVVFAALVLRWKTLWPAVLAHAALNTLSLLALRALGPPG